LNTPEAIKEAAQGKQWDAEKREWVEAPTDAVAIDDPVYADARARYQKTRAEANGKTFPYYYEVLGVSVRSAHLLFLGVKFTASYVLTCVRRSPTCLHVHRM
jgi:hypothetical protein